MIHAGKFALSNFKSTSGFLFGLDTSSNIVAALRQFADEIEAGKILVQKVQTGEVAAPDDWVMSGLFIEYVEKKE